MNRADELFETLLAQKQGRARPPVGDWQPERTGSIDIRIRADGSWWHEGVRFSRPALVRLFASILRRDDDGYCLVTPAEKLLVQVDDVPFVAVEGEIGAPGTPEQRVVVRTNVDDVVELDADHPLWVVDPAGSPRPYVHVRDGLDALVGRSLFYRLIEGGQEQDGELVLWSNGARFVLGPTR